MIVGFGNCWGRFQVARFLRERGFRLATAVHPRPTIAADVSIGAGSVVLHDILDGALAYGVPARVVRQQVPPHDHATYQLGSKFAAASKGDIDSLRRRAYCLPRFYMNNGVYIRPLRLEDAQMSMTQQSEDLAPHLFQT
jgi:hypothetical protein